VRLAQLAQLVRVVPHLGRGELPAQLVVASFDLIQTRVHHDRLSRPDGVTTPEGGSRGATTRGSNRGPWPDTPDRSSTPIVRVNGHDHIAPPHRLGDGPPPGHGRHAGR